MKNMGRQVFTCLPMLIYPGKKNQKSHNNFYQFFDKEGFLLGTVGICMQNYAKYS